MHLSRAELKEDDVPETQTCPRRMNEMGPWEHEEGQDSWREDDRDPEGVGHPNPGPCCSFCGSLHPEKFLELIADGWTVEPTDKTYKAYLPLTLDRPRSDVDPEAPLSVAFFGGRAKFYYQHFTEEQMQRFVDLYDDNTMRLGRPGYFYRMPFFMAADRIGGEA